MPLTVAGELVDGAREVATAPLACGAHHAMVEQGHHRIVMIDGVPHVIPPPWVDPQQQPVRNTCWQDQDHARRTGRQLALDLDTQLRRPTRRRPPDTG